MTKCSRGNHRGGWAQLSRRLCGMSGSASPTITSNTTGMRSRGRMSRHSWGSASLTGTFKGCINWGSTSRTCLYRATSPGRCIRSWFSTSFSTLSTWGSIPRWQHHWSLSRGRTVCLPIWAEPRPSKSPNSWARAQTRRKTMIRMQQPRWLVVRDVDDDSVLKTLT